MPPAPPSPRPPAATASTRAGSSPTHSAPNSCTFEGAGQRAAEIGRPDPDRPVIGLDLQGDDWSCTARVFRSAGERFVGRKGNDRRANTGNFHRLCPGGSEKRDQIASPRNGAQAPTVRGSQ